MDPPTALPTVKDVVTPTYPTSSIDPTRTAAPKQDPTKSVVGATSTAEQLQSGFSTAQDPGAGKSKSLDQPTLVSLKHIPTSLLQTSKLSLGTLAVVPASRDGLVSIGTNVLSDGEATTIGKTVVSLNSGSLVFGVEKSTPTTHTDPLNAVSVLAAAHTQGEPSAVFTLDGEAYTAYPGGLIAGESTTVDLSRHTGVAVAGHIVSMGGGKVWLDSTSIAFKESHGNNPPSSADHATTDETIVATFKHGSSRMTLSGYIDSAGNTVMTFGTSTLTYTGHNLVRDGTTYAAVGVSKDPIEQTSLPKIVSAGGSTAATGYTTQHSALNTGTGAAASTAKSSSSASSTSLESSMAVIVLAVLLML